MTHKTILSIIVAALLAAFMLARPSAAQHDGAQRDLPSAASVFAGPVLAAQSDPTGLWVPVEFALPPYPGDEIGDPDGAWLIDVELVGMRYRQSMQWGIENHTDQPVEPHVGLYIRHALDYVGYPGGQETASMGVSFGTHRFASLSAYDGVNDGAISWASKPGGTSGYWGGNGNNGLPLLTTNLYVPLSPAARRWWTKTPTLRYTPRGSWWFYSEYPIPDGHWYWWEDRIAGWVALPEEDDDLRVRYVIDRDGYGPMPAEFIEIRF